MGRGKILKNNKGFTLIELMIAIAIIGILALVLIPKVAGLKDNAKLTGLDTNVRVAISVAEGMVDDSAYTADQAGCTLLETDLNTKLTANAAANPFSKAVTVVAGAPGAGVAAPAYQYIVTAATESTDDAPFAGGAAYAGTVHFDAYVDATGSVKVRFSRCDKAGAVILAKEKTTN